MMHLTFDCVTKFYGPVIGINALSCRIGPGITGLLGANGAGKSTLLKLASGQLRASQGRVGVGRHRARSAAAKRHVGYSPDIDSFYEEMTGRQFVFSMACLNGYSRPEARRRTEQALAEVGMLERCDRRLAGSSHGMRQRIKLAQAIVHDPEILLLDEPLSGIDPGGRRKINELLLQWAGSGKTILVSTHVLVEIEQLADSVLMMSRGRIIASGSVAQLRELLEDQPLTIEILATGARRLAALLAEIPEVRSLELRDESLVVRTRNPPQFFRMLGQLVIKHGLDIRKLQSLDSGADAVFGYLERSAG